MKMITKKSEYDELIVKIKDNIDWYEKRNFDNKVFNLRLDNGEKLKIIFSHNNVAHLLGIQTEYLKTTGLFPKDSYDILKHVCNDSYRLYNQVNQGNLTYDSFISDYAFEKLEGFQSICGVDLYNMEFVCKYSKEYSYITGYPQLEADYYIGYKTSNGLYILGLKRNGAYYYPMTNRYIDSKDEEGMKFLKQMLENQKLTMPVLSSIYFKESGTYSRNLYLDYQKKAMKLRTINGYARKYNSSIDVSVGYNYVLEKLLKQFDSKNVLFPALKSIFEKVSKRIRIDITDIEMEFGALPEDILVLIDNYNSSLNVDISAALDEHTKLVEDENQILKSRNNEYLEELSTLKQQLLETKTSLENLQSENKAYKEREKEVIATMKRVYKI